MTAEDLIKVMEKAKELGFTEIKVDGVDLKIGPQITKSHLPDLTAEELVKPPSVLDDLSDEEILYFATPYFDELQAKKAKHQEALKEHKEITSG